MSPSTAELQLAARRLGFESCGVAAARPLSAGEFFRDWLAAGFFGEMTWLARDPVRRTDPRQLLTSCRSVIVVFMSYHSGQTLPKPTDEMRGRIASYALGQDYHSLMLARLNHLRALLQDPSARCYVDTGPVMERAIAAAAGLGWVGKNANLIVPNFGSYGFLGVILTGRELAPTSTVQSVSCGTCTRCLSSCPTSAILAPGRIDARRCISYLTVELRGAIPLELRSGLGDWIFGCDACQMVCPWNRRAALSQEPAFYPAPGHVFPRLAEWIGLTAEEFARLFSNSPLKRAKRTGLTRNIAVALGNLGDPRGIPPLRAAIVDPSPLVRSHAAWALGRLGDSHGLHAAYRDEQDPATRHAIEQALA
ncbi:MAG: tRNA epoxyqueuosine(34) reductase QueG [Cyanobacteria bacterium NC_groundwater_1444_Ag_S-0.65um_54_12]|nr:tRNA epoxyqueuosine(34) reductase QueG [Cyanobacteria bacterium NC_groundwater_1444_Ag_S-0.65um_54_12]